MPYIFIFPTTPITLFEVVLKCWNLAAQWEIQAPEKMCFDAGFRLEQ
jgi:hypothetical protein